MIAKRIFKTLGAIASPGGDKGKLQIFIFHRVLNENDPLMPCEPNIQRFDRLMSYVSKIYHVLPLAEAAERIKNQTLPTNAACITFDDGYVDNYTNAYPILKKYQLPATIFIATDYIDGGMMWNDIVIESIRRTDSELTVKALELDDIKCDTYERKTQLTHEILSKIKHMPQNQRSDIVNLISEETGFVMKNFMMNKTQIQTLSQQGISIGAHTCTHPILSKISREQSYQEIEQSKDILEKIVGKRVNLFAYPNGKKNQDYTNRDVGIVKDIGFDVAVSTTQKIATANDNLLELPRFTPWDKNIHRFFLRSLYETYRA